MHGYLILALSGPSNWVHVDIQLSARWKHWCTAAEMRQAPITLGTNSNGNDLVQIDTSIEEAYYGLQDDKL